MWILSLNFWKNEITIIILFKYYLNIGLEFNLDHIIFFGILNPQRI